MTRRLTHKFHPNRLHERDSFVYMQGLSKPRPQIRHWIELAILMGVLVALALLAIANVIF